MGTEQFHGTLLAGPELQQRWDAFVTGHPSGHLLQSYGWGDFKNRHNWPSIRVIVTEPGSDRILAGAQVLFRHIAGFSVAYIPRGPVVDWDNRPLVETLLQTIAGFSRKRRAIFLKIEPNRAYDPIFEGNLIRNFGFRLSSETVQPHNTIRVDLTSDQSNILDRMKPKTRYNIGLAERRGVICRQGDPARASDFASFYKLMGLTGQRDKFGIHSADYYRHIWEGFYNAPSGSGSSALWLADFKGEIIAGVMAFAFGGEAAYLYGASSNEHRREMPTYLLQWKAMQWAKEQGALWYDFWGIPDNIGNGEEDREADKEKNVRDGLWGVYRFKQGFGGEVFRYPGAFDLVYNRPLYYIWRKLKSRGLA